MSVDRFSMIFLSPCSDGPRIWITEENHEVFAYLWSNGTTTLNYTLHCSASSNISHFSILFAVFVQRWRKNRNLDVCRLIDFFMIRKDGKSFPPDPPMPSFFWGWKVGRYHFGNAQNIGLHHWYISGDEERATVLGACTSAANVPWTNTEFTILDFKIKWPLCACPFGHCLVFGNFKWSWDFWAFNQFCFCWGRYQIGRTGFKFHLYKSHSSSQSISALVGVWASLRFWERSSPEVP